MPERRQLSTAELFDAFPTASLERFRRAATRHRLERGEVVFTEGDEAHSLFLVLSGRVAIANRSRDGRESVVAIIGRGGIFGELGLFEESTDRNADARALSDARIAEVPYGPVLEELLKNPEVLYEVCRILTGRLRATDEALADAVFLDVPARTAKRLIEIAGDTDEFTLPITQEELAGMVGASRERVNKAISVFVRLGWIEIRGRNHYRIVDRDALADRAEP
ncbi:MAG: Crp/Fnr family transcriptional regulator [Acidimicrobiia bacterium]